MFDSDYCLGSGMTIVSEAQIRHDSISNWSTQSSRINMFYDSFDTQELSAQQPPLSSTRRTWEATVYHPTVTGAWRLPLSCKSFCMEYRGVLIELFPQAGEGKRKLQF